MSVTAPASVPVNGGCGPTPMIWIKVAIAHTEGLPENLWIAVEAARPIIIGKNGVGMSPGLAIIGFREQTAERGTEFEIGKHLPGKRHCRADLFHLLAGAIGDVDPAFGTRRLACRSGLTFHRRAHQLETKRQRPTIVKVCRCFYRQNPMAPGGRS